MAFTSEDGAVSDVTSIFHLIASKQFGYIKLLFIVIHFDAALNKRL